MFWKKWLSGKTAEASSSNSVDLRAVVVSDVGCVRVNNEDAARFVRPATALIRTTKGFLAIVADGMGGHAAGEIASQLAVETVAKTYYQREESPEESLFFALTKANRAIWQTASKNARYRGMGTTCTTIAVCEDQLFLAHVGDSRAYILKNGQLLPLSSDHTYVQSLVEQGIITRAEAEKHPERNVLTRAMGTHNKVEIDVRALPQLFENDDRLLLCTDGLYDYLNNDEIAQILMIPLLNEAAHQLVELAKQRGGHDNITVLLVERMSNESFQSVRPTEEING
ncbi:MAG TPA: Stp1/IreP family PP2C-type Ser/Thr phosphatase [Runella sp.]|nr:Stp1/IreP family PP2C-type Ser/Thr phosphatase [Runella sp.]HAO49455.1 Stp1/IreP family PP2C-type Ser/Thr phosphatase [Runella sp.]